MRAAVRRLCLARVWKTRGGRQDVMEYLITFLEGIISFISPCMLPMLPLYLGYFAGAAKRKRSLYGAVCFVVGFTVVFCLLGLFAGTAGRLLMRYQTVVNLVTGGIVILFGLGFLEVIPLTVFKGIRVKWEITNGISAMIFGVIFAVSLTPCIGAFLGSALMLASASGGSGKGMLLLLAYSLGMGIPFVISAVLIEKLQTAFAFIKDHYGVINKVCGGFLILVGILMLTGQLNRLLAVFSV